MYANAKLHLHKDLRVLLGQAYIRRALARAVRADRVSLNYFIADHAARLGSDKEAIWARDYASGRTVTYSWTELLERANQFAWWFLARGVKRGDLVGFYMLNSAEFVFAWVGLWAVGAAPAMVNYHLRGDALVHCLRISGARLVLVDGDAEAEKRIEEVSGEMRNNMKGERGMEFVRLADIRREVRAMKTDMPPHELRKGIKGTEPMALFYTSGTTGMPKGCAIPVAGGFGQGYGRVTGMNPVDTDRDRFCECCFVLLYCLWLTEI
jgi:acyl-CoA synthetase (AMP-forming)/AMP-acid ligase II